MPSMLRMPNVRLGKAGSEQEYQGSRLSGGTGVYKNAHVLFIIP